MGKRQTWLRLFQRAGHWLALATLFCLAAHSTSARGGPLGPDQSRPVRERALPGGYPSNPSLPPSSTIPVEPLGFSAPGPLYLGERNAMASLDFIDENRLLFTFRVPGLIPRSFKPGASADADVRQIRAVVLTISTGAVEAEALWSVHDRARYLWMLNNGHFLLRDKENLSEGDAHLDLKPLLQFPGPLLRIQLDPGQQFIVSNSLEPAQSSTRPGLVGSPATASATVTTDDQNAEPTGPDYVVRILRRETGKVLLVSRTRAMVHLPINAEGYLENLRGRGDGWVLNLNYFTGGSHILGSIDSNCAPLNDFITNDVVLATGCDASGSIKLVAVTAEGRVLWDDLNPATAVWPVLHASPDGSRIVQETLAVTHPVGPYSPLSNDDIKGQLVRVFNTATGEIAFESPANPILDAGGNVAISPSGRRVAVVNAGAIQVFELPPPPQIPHTSNQQPGR